MTKNNPGYLDFFLTLDDSRQFWFYLKPMIVLTFFNSWN